MNQKKLYNLGCYNVIEREHVCDGKLYQERNNIATEKNNKNVTIVNTNVMTYPHLPMNYSRQCTADMMNVRNCCSRQVQHIPSTNMLSLSHFVPTVTASKMPTPSAPQMLMRREITKEEEEVQQNNKETESDCVICLTSNSTHAIVPCGHQCVCETCAKQLPNFCPICRVNIDNVIKIFK